MAHGSLPRSRRRSPDLTLPYFGEAHQAAPWYTSGMRRALHKRYGHAGRHYGPRRMTLADAKNELRRHGVTLSKRDGEYRVSLPGGVTNTVSEGPAYYTNDLQDAVITGRNMRPRYDT